MVLFYDLPFSRQPTYRLLLLQQYRRSVRTPRRVSIIVVFAVERHEPDIPHRLIGVGHLKGKAWNHRLQIIV